MNRKLLYSILKFEITTQVKTKSFWLVSLIPPLAMFFMFIVNMNSVHIDSVLVDNRTSLPKPIESTGTMNVHYGTSKDWQGKGYDMCILIDYFDGDNVLCKILSRNINSTTNQFAIKDFMESKLAEAHIGYDFAVLKKQAGRKLKIETQIENPRYKLVSFSIIVVFLLYLIILQFSSSILKITGREKANKICEILLSAMSSRIILAGKLVACLIVAFMQITFWILVATITILIAKNITLKYIDQTAIDSIIQMIVSLPKDQLITFLSIFILYLVGGFFLYCILFSIIGAISNENTNTQQFSLIVTMPLLMTFMYVAKNYAGETQWMTILSYIPFSSPIAAIPIAAKQGLTIQILSSLFILFATTILAYYYSCTLYKNGALATKSKVTIGIVFKWLRK